MSYFHFECGREDCNHKETIIAKRESLARSKLTSWKGWVRDTSYAPGFICPTCIQKIHREKEQK